MGNEQVHMINKHALPEGLTLRPATKADFPLLYEMILDYEQQLFGTQESSFEELQMRWTLPGLDLAQDSRLAFDQTGRLVAYLRFNHAEFAEFQIGVQVRFGYEHPEIGDYLADLAESWANERMAQADPAARVTLFSWV